MKCNKICIIGVPEGEQREQGIKNLFEKKMPEKFPDMVKGKDTQVQEMQRIPNKMNSKRLKPRHNIIKIGKVKDKERISKAARGR